MATKTFKNLITLTQQINDNGYFIKTNAEEVSRVKWAEGGVIRSLSPEILKFSLYTIPYNPNAEPLDFSSNYQIGYFDSSGEYFELENLEEYLQFGYTDIVETDTTENGEQTKTLDPHTLYFNLQEFLEDEIYPSFLEEDLVISLWYKNGDEVVAIKNVPLVNGVSQDLAQFNITASEINSSVNGKVLKFSKEGLNIYGAGLSIYKSAEESNLIFGVEDNILFMKGNIYAEDGYFSGELKSPNGKIGGFFLEGNKFTSTDGSSIILDGENGSILANNIALGSGAKIKEFIAFDYYTITKDTIKNSEKTYYIKQDEEYIQFLGESFDISTIYYEYSPSYIHNPMLNNDSSFIETSGVKIYSDGRASFGKIDINGINSTIMGGNWSITPDYANFSNINVSGSIETAVFKTGSTQAAGGAMIFRPSYKIKGFNISTPRILAIAEEISFKTDDIIWLVKDGSDIYKATKVATCVITDGATAIFVTDDLEEGYSTLIHIGSEENEEAIIGINSGTAPVGEDLIKPKGLTITTISKKQEDKPNLFLGDLQSVGFSGHGLYADNVYLNGSLTTQVGEEPPYSYAGINTLNGANAIAFGSDPEFDKKKKTLDPGEIDTSKIVFWAGANSVDAEDIQRAYFQVTEEGSVYAQRAKLEDTLLVGGEIRGTDIYTARLHGDNGALTIYDTQKGIVFKTGYNTENELETFSIGHTGFNKTINSSTKEQRNFINIGNTIQFNGDKFSVDTNSTNKISLEIKNEIPVLYHEQGESNCGFYFESAITSFKIKEQSILELSSTESLFTGGLSLQGKIEKGQDTFIYQMQYKPVDGGYDLFVV